MQKASAKAPMITTVSNPLLIFRLFPSITVLLLSLILNTSFFPPMDIRLWFVENRHTHGTGLLVGR
jgi:hypothetical protein